MKLMDQSIFPLTFHRNALIGAIHNNGSDVAHAPQLAEANCRANPSNRRCRCACCADGKAQISFVMIFRERKTLPWLVVIISCFLHVPVILALVRV